MLVNECGSLFPQDRHLITNKLGIRGVSHRVCLRTCLRPVFVHHASIFCNGELDDEVCKVF